ncbi:aryl-sulfate sulfotransferase [Nocardioides donggukensis]|uniref:Aryl-sulfate sulfotransferase n=1 Tax=Nocardioides donggukensis TaxID=2774019 RepID=A0A927K7C2_9ACTN|nr:aryl-sulfate sulfotransferase [Nocardioides donggukensis]MBD8870500.1 aryl-sulfate sulfotransferase [Nocardioides donggukensis]
MYPAYDPATERYAATTTGATDGRLTVEVTTADPAGEIWIDGRPDGNGRATVTGLEGGDEVAVFIEDAGGRAVYSVVYLPVGFPELGTPTKTTSVAPGDVLLTLSRFDRTDAPTFETSVNVDGVPSYVRSSEPPYSSLDLKPNGYGGYTVARQPTDTPGRLGARIVELDGAFREVRSLETVGLQHTDTHDSIVREDGSRILTGYEPNADSGLTDAVIQEVGPDGEIVHTWNSADHPGLRAASLARESNPDYMHINSIEVMADGHILASFRHTSQVLKIAWHTRDGDAVGDIIWRLGGRDSDFEFVDDPFAGPCAQHTANELPNGNILIFDNGSPTPSGLFPDSELCVDPDDPQGEAIGRNHTRVTEYALDESSASATATLVRSYRRESWFALFAGSVRPVPGESGNTLIGWASARQAIATEIGPDDEVVWELRDVGADGAERPAYFSYRAVKAQVPDAVDPVVDLRVPGVDGEVVQGSKGKVRYSCRDRGGSSLQECTSDAGRRVDTSTLGPGSVTVTATDGAGNSSTITHDYTVVERLRPDAWIRRPGKAWQGKDVYGRAKTQSVGLGLRRVGRDRDVVVALQNDGAGTARARVRGTRGNADFRVRYRAGGRNVTDAVVAGTYRTGRLGSGARERLRIVVSRRPGSRAGDERTIRVRMLPAQGRDPRDAVAAVVTATG